MFFFIDILMIKSNLYEFNKYIYLTTIGSRIKIYYFI